MFHIFGIKAIASRIHLTELPRQVIDSPGFIGAFALAAQMAVGSSKTKMRAINIGLKGTRSLLILSLC